MSHTKVFEQGDRYFFLGPVSPLTPGANEVEEFAFAETIRKMAPNENLLWMRGQYVEADTPNANGQQWTADEVAVKALTPNFMPVTIMHDPSISVGLIADTSLLVPEKDEVAKARIDTTLAIWAHRYPDTVEEALANYKQGTLMQSMEALSPYYACSGCGQVFHKLPDGSERANWCSHLKGDEGEKAARILGNVTFTGTGLIFGTRDGAKGANGKAYLELSVEELAQYHEEAHSAIRTSKRRRPSKDRKVKVETVEISKSEYNDLLKAKEELAQLKESNSKAESAKAEAEKKTEELETAKVAAEQERDKYKKEAETLQEKERQNELASSRIGDLGKGFLSALGDFTQANLREDAKSLDDDAWENRLKELEEMSSRKRDDGADDKAKDDDKRQEFSREEFAKAGLGGGSKRSSHEPSSGERRSVVAGLLGDNK